MPGFCVLPAAAASAPDAADAEKYLSEVQAPGVIEGAVSALLTKRPPRRGDAIRLLARHLEREADEAAAAAEKALVGVGSGDRQHPGGQSPQIHSDPDSDKSPPSADSLRPLQGLYRPELKYQAAGAGAIDEAQVRRIVREMVPHVKGCSDAELPVSVVTGGITNQLFKVVVPAEKGQSVLMRIFGAEGMIDRELENATYVALSEAGLAPPYYGRFGNGRLEGWLPTRALQLDDMADPAVYQKVAAQMGRLHRFKPPPGLSEHYREPGLWQQLFTWLQQAADSVEKLKQGGFGPKVCARAAVLEHDLLGPGLSRASHEVAALKRVIPADAPVAFCHNDALSGNILKDPETGEIRLIDFEYGGTNFRGFDIANHWNEWAGGTDVQMNGVPEYGRFPTPQQQADFCAAYLRQSGGDVADTAALVSESLKFVLVNHWYWGLWAVNRAAEEGVDEFDYLTYARNRFAKYYADKERYGGD